MSASDYTNGAPWLLTNKQPDGEASVALDFLFPDGSRKRVYLDEAHASDERIAQTGDALAAGRTGRVKAK